MKKYFLYEVKQALLPTIIFTAIACVIYILSIEPSYFILSIEPSYFIYSDGTAGSCCVFSVQTILMVLCTITPILNFAFKGKAREVDLWYSMPISREKLYAVKSAISILQALIPYTVAYWLGFLYVIAHKNIFFLQYYFYLYLISLALAVSLIGLNAFFFTRANNLVDGIANIFFISCVGALLVFYIYQLFPIKSTDPSFWFTYSPITATTTMFSELIQTGEFVIGYITINLPSGETYEMARHLTFACMPVMHTVFGVLGAGSWFGLFYMLKHDKAENSERISTSLIGYKSFIPIYVALITGLIGFEGYMSALFIAIIVALGAIAYFGYKRSFKLAKNDIIALCTSVIVGVILSTLI
ncbi:MAG: hypothetical protein E7370_04685 [Clostridiales bacterium]|nr:hypothetical protein [Clostridiales bacterium]